MFKSMDKFIANNNVNVQVNSLSKLCSYTVVMENVANYKNLFRHSKQYLDGVGEVK